jgi:hypothetical protein
VLKTVQRALPGQRCRRLSPAPELADQHAENGIAAQLLMVDEILIAQRQAEHPLRDQGLHLMHHIGAMAPVAKAARKAIDEPDGLVRLPEQEGASIRGHHPAIEIRDHPASARSSEIDLVRATLCLHRGATSNRHNSFSQNKFTPSEAPMRLRRVRNAG